MKFRKHSAHYICTTFVGSLFILRKCPRLAGPFLPLAALPAPPSQWLHGSDFWGRRHRSRACTQLVPDCTTTYQADTCSGPTSAFARTSTGRSLFDAGRARRTNATFGMRPSFFQAHGRFRTVPQSHETRLSKYHLNTAREGPNRLERSMLGYVGRRLCTGLPRGEKPGPCPEDAELHWGNRLVLASMRSLADCNVQPSSL